MKNNPSTYEERMADWHRKQAAKADGKIPHEDVREIKNGVHRAKTEPGRRSTEEIKPRAICADDVKIEIMRWLWEKRIPRGAITILEGEEGIGKGMALCAIAAAVTTGKGLPDMVLDGPETVLWFAAEDSASMTLKPRWLDAGADVKHIYVDDEPFTLDADGIQRLRAECELHHPALVVLDPVFSYTKGNPNEGHNSRQLTNELKKIAAEFDCAIILVRHIGKSKGLGDPRAAGLYSIEWRAAARSVLLAGADQEDKSRRAIFHTKHNASPQAEPIGYKIESEATAHSGAKFYWTGQTELTPEAVLAPIMEEEERSKVQEAAQWLTDLLAEREASEITAKRLAEKAGFSPATLRRAKRNAGVSYRYEGKGADRTSYWGLKDKKYIEEPLRMLTSTREHPKNNSAGNQKKTKEILRMSTPMVDEHPKSNEHPKNGIISDCLTCPICDHLLDQFGACDWCVQEERAAIQAEGEDFH